MYSASSLLKALYFHSHFFLQIQCLLSEFDLVDLSSDGRALLKSLIMIVLLLVFFFKYISNVIGTFSGAYVFKRLCFSLDH